MDFGKLNERLNGSLRDNLRDNSKDNSRENSKDNSRDNSKENLRERQREQFFSAMKRSEYDYNPEETMLDEPSDIGLSSQIDSFLRDRLGENNPQQSSKSNLKAIQEQFAASLPRENAILGGLSDDRNIICQIVIQKGDSEEEKKVLALRSIELEQLDEFVKEIENICKKEQEDRQQKRSQKLTDKIASNSEGARFLAENMIVKGANNIWYRVIKTFSKTPDGRDEVKEMYQNLNFFIPDHSWVLEKWICNRAFSWSIKRVNNREDKCSYQVSFGFPDQSFLEAEGPTKEGSIVALAEDLFGSEI